MDRDQGVIERIRSLKKAQLQVSLDDFGHGYSSLNFLKRFQIDYLNLQRAGVTQTRVSSGDAMRDVAITNADSGPTPGSVVNTLGATDFWHELDIALHSLLGEAPGREVVVSPQANLVVVRGLPSELRIFPTFGSSQRDGHSFPYRGVSVWSRDTLRFLEQHCVR